MFRLESLTEDLCRKFKAEALLSLHGNSCSIENIDTTCFASEACMYGGRFPMLDSLLSSNYSYIISCDENFCACVAAENVESIPNFEKINIKKSSLFLHTLCVDKRYRKNRLASSLINKIKSKNKDVYLTVVNGKNGLKKDLVNFFEKRSSNLLSFYEKQGFKKISENNKYILLCYETI